MGNAHKISEVKPQPVPIASSVKSFYSICLFLGLATLVFGISKKPDHFWPAFLLNYWFFLTLGLGGLLITSLQFVAGAGWSVVIRRIPEAMAAYIPFSAIAMVILVFGAKKLYMWLDPSVMADDELLLNKASYLNWSFFLVRAAIFYGLWLLFKWKIVGNSVKQDQSGDEGLTRSNVPWSIAFVMLFALSYSFHSVDTLMSLQPHWYSTMFGVYCLAGMLQSSFAVIILFTVWLMKNNAFGGAVNDNHLHDLGKFLKAFTVFWAYIAFSQFMLIWYANLPEETEFYLHRSHHGWMAVSLSLLFFKFIVPFIALLPRWAKRTPGYLCAISVLIIFMQLVDNYWLIFPNFNENQVVFGPMEIGTFLLFLGLFLMAVTRFLSSHNSVPVKDPRLHESLSHVVTY